MPEAAARPDADLAAALRGTPVLLALGLAAEVIALLRPFGVEYMDTQTTWLRGLGLDVRVVRVPTGGEVAPNAATIATALRESPRPALLIGHSKGGVESLAALLEKPAPPCAGFIALQAPFHGSELADAILRLPPLALLSRLLMRLFRCGSGEALRDLGSATRQGWMREHAAALAALPARLPVLTAAAAMPERPRNLRERLLRPLAWVMKRGGAGPNDGQVSVASATLPGVVQQVSTGDHRALVARGANRDPIDALRQLLWQLVATRQPSPPAPVPHPGGP